MKKLTAKDYVDGQLPVNYYTGSGYIVDTGRFAISTIRRAINNLGYKSKVDNCGNVFALTEEY